MLSHCAGREIAVYRKLSRLSFVSTTILVNWKKKTIFLFHLTTYLLLLKSLFMIRNSDISFNLVSGLNLTLWNKKIKKFPTNESKWKGKYFITYDHLAVWFVFIQLKEYKTDPWFLQLSKNLLIFCTNSERETAFVLICRTGWTISGLHLVQKTYINKESVFKFLFSWRNYGSVSYSFSCKSCHKISY